MMAVIHRTRYRGRRNKYDWRGHHAMMNRAAAEWLIVGAAARVAYVRSRRELT
jgi:hypothetical protein